MIREFYGSAFFLVNKATKKSSKGRRRHQHTRQASASMGRKKGRKRKKRKTKSGGSTQQQQQQQNKVLKQSNLDGLIVETLDVEGFGDCFHPTQSTEFTRIAFQNSGPQPQFRTSKKATDGALAMEAGKFDALLFAEHRLYPPALQPRHG